MLGPDLPLDDWKIVREELAQRARDLELRLQDDVDMHPAQRARVSIRLGVIDNAIKEM